MVSIVCLIYQQGGYIFILGAVLFFWFKKLIWTNVTDSDVYVLICSGFCFCFLLNDSLILQLMNITAVIPTYCIEKY